MRLVTKRAVLAAGVICLVSSVFVERGFRATSSGRARPVQIARVTRSTSVEPAPSRAECHRLYAVDSDSHGELGRCLARVLLAVPRGGGRP